MREVWVGTGATHSETGEVVTCEYYILVRDFEDNLFCESYGLKVTLAEYDESAELPDLTPSSDEIQALAERLRRNVVTPCTLRDVIDDWL